MVTSDEPPAQQRSVLWSGLDGFSADYCTLARTGAGWLLTGTALLAFDGLPARADYRVECDRAWATRLAAVDLRLGGEARSLRLTVDDRRRWRVNGEERDDLLGCADADLGVTPATNTLPIRRLDLAIGATADVTAAWVRFPMLTVETLAQRYTRLAERRYGYASATGFRADLDVDDLGLITGYPDGWERVAAS